MANSDVKLKHKIQLRKKVVEPAVPVGTETGDTSTPFKSSSKTWLWILLIVIALCVIGYFIFSKSGDTAVTESEQETEMVEETIVLTDSLTNKEEAMEEVLPTDENDISINADNQETKVNESPATTDTNSNLATTKSSTTSNNNISNDVEAEAMKVIRGDYGVGQERKDRLGTKYQPIQSRVNELKREGIF